VVYIIGFGRVSDSVMGTYVQIPNQQLGQNAVGLSNAFYTLYWGFAVLGAVASAFFLLFSCFGKGLFQWLGYFTTVLCVLCAGAVLNPTGQVMYTCELDPRYATNGTVSSTAPLKVL
jgi:hypothetical protein